MTGATIIPHDSGVVAHRSTSNLKLKKIFIAGIVVGLILVTILLVIFVRQPSDTHGHHSDPDPDPGPVPKESFDVIDYKDGAKISFPLFSRWTTFGSPEPRYVKRPPYKIPPDIRKYVIAEVLVKHESCKLDQERGLMFLDNTTEYPKGNTFFLFYLPGNANNIVAVSRAQDTVQNKIDVWVVAWGSVTPLPGPFDELSYTVSVTSTLGTTISGNLYGIQNIYTSGQTNPYTFSGPGNIGDEEFYKNAKAKLGPTWDGITAQTAIETYDASAHRFFYYMQINEKLAIGCNLGKPDTDGQQQYECTVGEPDTNLAQFPYLGTWD